MIAQIRAELLKLRTTRTTIALILAMIALILLFTLLDGLLSHPGALASRQDQRQLLSVSSFTAVFAALAGVLLVTSEYRYGTIRPTILFNPARSRVLAAKAVAGALAGLAFGILGEAIGWAVGCATLDGRGITVVLSSGDILLLTLGGLAGAALWGAIGAGLGAIIHNQVGAIIALLAWGLVVDDLLFGLAPSVGRFTPTRASDALMGLRVDHLLSPGAGAITLIAWAGALTVVGIALSARQDIN
jgi:ABC-2 type transport system permease protein